MMPSALAAIRLRLAACAFALALCGGARAQKPFNPGRAVAPGDYSGITHLGGGRFAVVDDKNPNRGFYIWHIDIDTIRGRIRSVASEGFFTDGSPGSDEEGIAWCAPRASLMVSSEADGRIREFLPDGTPTGRSLPLPVDGRSLRPNLGFEALTYGHGRFYTTTERPLVSDSLLRIFAFDDSLRLAACYAYRPDGPAMKHGYHGVSALCALSDGRLLVMEREVRVPRLKIGAKTVVKIYEVSPSAPAYADGTVQKRLAATITTRFNLLSRRFANYEGMCQPCPGWLLLIADSQHRYRGLLKDWLLLIRVPKLQ